MGNKLVDRTGERYGRLTVIRRAKRSEYYGYDGYAMWVCKCDCGNELIVAGTALASGNTQSCGCLCNERIRDYHAKKRKGVQ